MRLDSISLFLFKQGVKAQWSLVVSRMSPLLKTYLSHQFMRWPQGKYCPIYLKGRLVFFPTCLKEKVGAVLNSHTSFSYVWYLKYLQRHCFAVAWLEWWWLFNVSKGEKLEELYFPMYSKTGYDFLLSHPLQVVDSNDFDEGHYWKQMFPGSE